MHTHKPCTHRATVLLQARQWLRLLGTRRPTDDASGVPEANAAVRQPASQQAALRGGGRRGEGLVLTTSETVLEWGVENPRLPCTLARKAGAPGLASSDVQVTTRVSLAASCTLAAALS